MLAKTRGIVFRKLPYSETSVITDIYTLENGLMSYIISGVRKPRARTSASLLEVMSIVDMLAYHSDKKKLHRIKEIRPAYVYQSIPFEVRKGAILLFMAELCSKTIRETERNPELFETIIKYLEKLDQSEKDYSNIHLEFMISLADELGFGPTPNYSSSAQGFDMMGGEFVEIRPSTHFHYIPEAYDLAQLIEKSRGADNELHFTRESRNALVDHLVDYFRIHVDSLREINSHLILREVL
jgi:DNA repair protein RecO (recombination protein O)